MTDMGNKKHARLTPEEELKAVALLARGDTIPQIRQYFKDNGMRPIQESTVTAIRKRNKENLDLIKSKMLAKEAEDAMAIKDKANSAIKHKLDRLEQQGKMIDRLNEQLQNGVIDYKEYSDTKKRLREANLSELVAVSREMHVQSKDDGTDDKNTTTKDLSELVKAIRSGDEVKLQQIVFNSGGDK